jgi:hypothetical protein
VLAEELSDVLVAVVVEDLDGGGRHGSASRRAARSSMSGILA